MADLSGIFGGNGFDAGSIEPNTGGFTPLPAGDYLMQIVEAELMDTKDGMGKYLKLVMEVIHGEHSGRKHFENLNLVNNNEKTVEIAQRAFSGICRAVGVLNARDTREIEFKPFVASISVDVDGRDRHLKPTDADYASRRLRNNIKKYTSANDGGGQNGGMQRQPMPQGGGMPQNSGMQAQRPAAHSGQPAAPWQRRA